MMEKVAVQKSILLTSTLLIPLLKNSQLLLLETFGNILGIDRKNTKAMAHTTSPNEVGGVVRVLPFAKKEPFLIDPT